MRTYAIIDAEIEAKRFLLAIKRVKKEFPNEMCEVYHDFMGASKHTARLRRASMDLTRSLAVMRKP